MITDEPDRAEEHRLRMQSRKARVDARVAAATQDRGVLLVLTGSGKGKSSSAFGMLARALGHGMRVGIVQFIKGTFSTGEEALASSWSMRWSLSWAVRVAPLRIRSSSEMMPSTQPRNACRRSSRLLWAASLR